MSGHLCPSARCARSHKPTDIAPVIDGGVVTADWFGSFGVSLPPLPMWSSTARRGIRPKRLIYRRAA